MVMGEMVERSGMRKEEERGRRIVRYSVGGGGEGEGKWEREGEGEVMGGRGLAIGGGS